MDPLHRIAERRIDEALASGAFDDYPGKHEPFAPDEGSAVDPELRAVRILLAGHGYLGEEGELRRRIVSLPSLFAACSGAGERNELAREGRRLRRRLVLLLEERGVPLDVIERLLDVRPEDG